MATFGFNLVLVVSTLLILFGTTGYALLCYECNSPVGGACGNFKSINLTSNINHQNCSLKNEVCGISTEIVGGYDTKIKRSCVPDNFCASVNSTGFATECRTCKSDLCNSSYNVVPSFGIITFLVLCFSCLHFDLFNIHKY